MPARPVENRRCATPNDHYIAAGAIFTHGVANRAKQRFVERFGGRHAREFGRR